MRKNARAAGCRAAIRTALAILFLAGMAALAQPGAPENCAASATCLVASPSDSVPEAERYSPAGDATSMVTMTLRTRHGGPLAHRWIELHGPDTDVTLGFGPASIPFLDAGKISTLSAQGETERMTPLHLFFHSFNYAKPPGEGRTVGEPILLTRAQANALLAGLQRHHLIAPYIPIFHDCRTFTCALQAKAKGKSTLPCYVLLKGYW